VGTEKRKRREGGRQAGKEICILGLKRYVPDKERETPEFPFLDMKEIIQWLERQSKAFSSPPP